MKAENLIDLLYLPITDNNIVNSIDELGMPQPVIDDQYYEELSVSTSTSDEGISFIFREVEGISKKGNPILTSITIESFSAIKFPYGINSSDTYSIIVKKIGKEADFKHQFLQKTKYWILERKDRCKYSLAVYFEDTSFEGVEAIVISIYVNEDDHGLGAIEPNTD